MKLGSFFIETQTRGTKLPIKLITIALIRNKKPTSTIIFF